MPGSPLTQTDKHGSSGSFLFGSAGKTCHAIPAQYETLIQLENMIV
jgi:hypothetical protein